MTSPQSLKRTVGLPGAVLLGLGSILGTGVFVALGLAVGVAGQWAVAALGIAALLASCNALSSAQLAAAHPVSGGTYAYGYKYISPLAGFMAGWAFLLAKSASAAAAALSVIAYSAALLGIDIPLNILAAGLALIMSALVASGLRRASKANALLVGVTILGLVALIAATFIQAPIVCSIPSEIAPANLFQAAALLFVAFTGYGRIATLGEEVVNPRRTIPRAIIITLMVSAALYLAVLLAGISGLGLEPFAAKTLNGGAPLQALADTLNVPGLRQIIALSAITAMGGVLLNLLLGLSRVALAMGRNRDMPSVLARINTAGEPALAVWAVGIFIAAIALFGGLAMVWSFSAFTVLIYYSITNIAALQLPKSDRLYPRAISWLGLLGCLGLAAFVDIKVMAVGAVILVVGVLGRLVIKRPSL